MIQSHKWIYENYSNVVRIKDLPDGTVECYDAEENVVAIDMDTAKTKSDEDIASRRLKSLRTARNQLLLDSDWTQNADAPITAEKKAEWDTYRQALRDITDTYTSLEDVVWPTKPE